MLDHGVENGQQLAHAGSQGDLFYLARSQEPLVEGLDHGVVPGCRQSSHLQDCAHPGPAAPYLALAPHQAAVSVEGGEANQGSDVPAVRGTQFGEFGHEGERHDWADALDTAEQVIFDPPEGAFLDGIAQEPVTVSQFVFQPKDVLLDSLKHWRSSGSQPVGLRSEHLHELVASGQESSQLLGLGVRQGPWGWLYGVGEMSRYLSIQPVGLGQFAGGSGEVADLPGVDHCHRQTGGAQGGSQWQFQASGGFHYHQGWGHLSQVGHYCVDPCFIVDDPPRPSELWIRRYLCKALFGSSSSSSHRPVLADTGSVGPGNCSGSARDGCDDSSSPSVSQDPESIGLSHPESEILSSQIQHTRNLT